MIQPVLLVSILVSLSAFGCVACDPKGGGLHGDLFEVPRRPVCTLSYATAPTDVGIVGDPLLVEVSGVVASWWRDDTIWMHNDSGDAARLYAIGVDAEARGRVELKDATFVDVEDMAVGLCPERQLPCLFVADTGDNGFHRANAAIFILEEPRLEELSPDVVFSTDRYIRIPLSFEGGPVNVEAIVVDPKGDSLLLIEKIDQDGARVFQARGPFKDGQSVEAAVLFKMPPVGLAMLKSGRMITGADLHPSGSRLAIRTYTGVYELRIADGQDWSAFGSAKAKLVALGPFSEPQGEAIAYSASGDALITVSEDPKRANPQMMHHYPCQPSGKGR